MSGRVGWVRDERYDVKDSGRVVELEFLGRRGMIGQRKMRGGGVHRVIP